MSHVFYKTSMLEKPMLKLLATSHGRTRLGRAWFVHSPAMSVVPKDYVGNNVERLVQVWICFLCVGNDEL